MFARFSGSAIERVALRPLQGKARIAPLLATIGLSFVLDQLVQLVCSPDPRAVPSDLPDWRLAIGGVSIGPMDLLIAAVGIVSAALLYAFLRFTKLGFAVRATAQDRDAALQMGVNVNAVNSAVFAIASALGGLGGLLVGMYYNHIDPAMSFQATLKGVVAQVIGGVGNVPGAILGGALLGLTESYGIAAFGTTYRNLFAFVLLIVFLIWFPNGLFGARSAVRSEPLVGTFIAPSRPIRLPRWLVAGAHSRGACAALRDQRAVSHANPHQRLARGRACAQSDPRRRDRRTDLARSGRASGDWRLCVGAACHRPRRARDRFRAGGRTDYRGARHAARLSRLSPARALHRDRDPGDRRDREPRHSQLGEPDRRRDGTDRHSSLVLPRSRCRQQSRDLLDLSLVVAHCDRRSCRRGSSTRISAARLRAVREDEIAAQSYGVDLDRYKALAFAFGGFAAGVAGAITAHLYSYLNSQTFDSQLSLLALTMVILGGMGNVLGAIVGAVVLVGLPELFRVAAEYRILIYGVVLLLLVRFRPQGLLGTV